MAQSWAKMALPKQQLHRTPAPTLHCLGNLKPLPNSSFRELSSLRHIDWLEKVQSLVWDTESSLRVGTVQATTSFNNVALIIHLWFMLFLTSLQASKRCQIFVWDVWLIWRWKVSLRPKSFRYRFRKMVLFRAANDYTHVLPLLAWEFSSPLLKLFFFLHHPLPFASLPSNTSKSRAYSKDWHSWNGYPLVDVDLYLLPYLPWPCSEI